MDYGELAILAGALTAHKDLIQEIYGDLFKPGVSQVGKALETILGLGNTILWPIQVLNGRAKIALENNFEKYRQQLKDVSDADIISVRPEVGVPILEKLAYVTDDEISDLYINLLAKASTTQTAQFAHPSFVNIINNLSPDEAILLKSFRGILSGYRLFGSTLWQKTSQVTTPPLNTFALASKINSSLLSRIMMSHISATSKG